MAVFNTIKETSEVDAALSQNGAESIIVDGKLVGLRIGPLRIASMKGVYFDQIARGEKTEEYRLRTDYWERRLLGRTYRNVVLTRGYPKDGGVEGVTRLTMPWRGYRYQTLQHDHFGPEPVHVFAIKVSATTTKDSQ